MTAILALIGPKLIGFAVAALMALGAMFKYRSSLIKAERARQAAAEAKAREIGDQVENDIGALTPEQRKGRLKRWSKD